MNWGKLFGGAAILLVIGYAFWWLLRPIRRKP